MKNYEPWEKLVGKISSSKGQWKIGDGVYSHGKDLLKDIIFNKSYMQLVVLNSTGKQCDENFAKMLEAIHICLSWPDSRIWCNRIGALGGTSRSSVVAAVCAGNLAADSKIYGMKTLVEGVKTIQRFGCNSKSGLSCADIVEKEIELTGSYRFMGFSRPIAKGDERVEALLTFMKNIGLDVGYHLKLAFDIEKLLFESYDETLNVGGFISALMVDNKYSAQEVYRIFSVLVFSGVNACYVEEVEKVEGSYSPIPVSNIDYVGTEDRALL